MSFAGETLAPVQTGSGASWQCTMSSLQGRMGMQRKGRPPSKPSSSHQRCDGTTQAYRPCSRWKKVFVVHPRVHICHGSCTAPFLRRPRASRFRSGIISRCTTIVRRSCTASRSTSRTGIHTSGCLVAIRPPPTPSMASRSRWDEGLLVSPAPAEAGAQPVRMRLKSARVFAALETRVQPSETQCGTGPGAVSAHATSR